MRKPLIVFIALAAAAPLLAGQSTAREQREARAMKELDKALTGYTAGEAQLCLDPRTIRNPEAFGEKTLIFRQGKAIIWRSDTKGGCDELGDDKLETRQFGSRMCRGDRATTVDITGDETGSCVLGDFVPYRRNK